MQVQSTNPFEQMTTAAAKASPKKASGKAKSAAKAVASKPAKAEKVTKKSQAVIFYKKNIKKGKSIVIDFFKGDLSMTDAGANSYFYAIKKELAQAAA